MKKNLVKSLAIGFLAGGAGTLAMSAALLFETRVLGPDQTREMEQVPARAVEKTTGIQFDDISTASKGVHWTYGSMAGEVRAVLDQLGIRGLKASLIHFAFISFGASIITPLLGLEPWPFKMKLPKLLAQTSNHLLYALVAGAVYDALSD